MFEAARRFTILMTFIAVSAGTLACGASEPAAPDRIPLTTSSDEARQLYEQALDMQNNLATTDAHALFQQAVAADPELALGYVGLANTAPSTTEFVDAVGEAVARVDSVSDGERLVILAQQAGLMSDPDAQMNHLTELAALYPNDERSHSLLGNLYFGRQDYAGAMGHFDRAIELDPSFAAVYNMRGYAARFLGNMDDAEASFLKYIELVPTDPNSHDSYAELLMKMGRFDESIQHYEQAISIDANWVNGFVGIGNNQMFQGQFDEARATFAKELDVARNNGERRQAHFWIAASHVHQGATDEAIASIQAGMALSEADGDMATVAGDLTQIGDILREAGRFDEALASYAKAVETMNGAMDVPAEFKDNAARNLLFEQGRVAVAQGDLDTARERSAAYAEQVAMMNRPGEVRQQHELAGRIALADEDFATALTELGMANQQNPSVLYLTALAHQGAGDTENAMRVATEVANFNGLNFNLAYVQTKATQMAGQ